MLTRNVGIKFTITSIGWYVSKIAMIILYHGGNYLHPIKNIFDLARDFAIPFNNFNIEITQHGCTDFKSETQKHLSCW